MKLLFPTLFSPTMTMLSPVSTSRSEKLAKFLILIREIRTVPSPHMFFFIRERG
jgi:hypothetical protein